MSVFGNLEQTVVEVPETDVKRIDAVEIQKLDVKIKFERSGFIPRNGGEWTGEPGNSIWKPDPELTPFEKSCNPEKPYSNPNGLSWGELMDKYGIEGITFRNGEPDFSEVAKGTVEIDDFSSDRDENFSQADEKLAEQRGCTPEEVEKWRKENNYTWHECKDCKTMQKVPNEIHANIIHSGGIAECKAQNTSAEIRS